MDIADDPHADPPSLELWHFDPAKSDRARIELLGTFPSIGEMALTSNGLFFEPLGHDGRQLWLTDGTAAVTRPVDLDPLGERIESAFIRKAVAGGVLLEVSTPERGRELGFTDGTRRGTFLLPEINRGPAGSNLHEIEVFGERVYVSAFRPDVGQELFAFDLAQLSPPCVSSETSACLGNGRFEAAAEWTDPRSGERRAASVASTTDDTAFFWFFTPGNFEAAVKVIDGTALNGHHWIFTGGLTDLEVEVTVRDTHTGSVRTFPRAAGARCGIADIEAFGAASEVFPSPSTSPVSASVASPHRPYPVPATAPREACGDALCLHSGRFRLEVEWRDDATQRSGRGTPIPATDQSGHFWFFDAHNVELTAKLLDGTGVNGAWWLFHAPLTDLPYTLRVLDTATGDTRTIEASGGGLCGGVELWSARDESSAARADARR